MSGRVLLIEDEERIAEFVMRGLTEEGFVITHAADGAAGWIELKRDNWDVILLDWWLPGDDGLQLLKRFRAINRATPVLFLTARDAIRDRVDGLNAGADDYLSKPFAFEELLARIRALLRRQDAVDTHMIEYRGIRMDLTTQRAARNNQPLELTAREFALLAFLLKKPGAVYSRTRIYEAVWGDAFDGTSNTIEVHIKALRKKLEQHGPRVIQTRRGRGYVLEIEDEEVPS